MRAPWTLVNLALALGFSACASAPGLIAIGVQDAIIPLRSGPDRDGIPA